MEPGTGNLGSAWCPDAVLVFGEVDPLTAGLCAHRRLGFTRGAPQSGVSKRRSLEVGLPHSGQTFACYASDVRLGVKPSRSNGNAMLPRSLVPNVLPETVRLWVKSRSWARSAARWSRVIGNSLHAKAGRVVDGVCERRSRAADAQFADPFRTEDVCLVVVFVQKHRIDPDGISALIGTW